MPAPTFQEELAAYGPVATPARIALADAERYCRVFALRHYENFSVASLLIPKTLRQHFFNLYAYCRWADDLADETTSVQESLDLLAWWEGELDRCYRGEATHPVMIALRPTIEEFNLPQAPLRDLLVAFRQDQTKTRYESFDELRGYCRYSADPVGRLVLHLGRCYSNDDAVLSDCICTGLQLVNHWQDVARDHAKGRVYLPHEDLRRFGVDEAVLSGRQTTAQFRDLLKFEVDRAEQYLLSGRELCTRVAPVLRRQVRLFLGGGLAIVDEIRRADYDVLSRRPTVSRWRKVRLLAGAWLMRGGSA